MKKIIKHYPMTDRLIVRRGYILFPPQLLEGPIHTQDYGSKLVVKTLVLFFVWFLFFSPSFLLCYKTIVINAHIVYVYAPCGPLIGESINL